MLRRPNRGGRVFRLLIESSQLLKPIGDAVSVFAPPVRSTITVVIKIAEIIKDAKHNKKSCYEIGDRINQLVRVMFAQLSDGGVKLDSGMVGRVRKLRDSLHVVLANMEVIAEQNFARRAVRRLSDKDIIRDIEDEIRRSLELFTLGTTITTASALDVKFIREHMRRPPDFLDSLRAGYLWNTFQPLGALRYLRCLLKADVQTMAPVSSSARWSGALFVHPAYDLNPSTEPLMRITHPQSLLDYEVIVDRGTVVRQLLWVPRGTHRYNTSVTDAQLEMPIFFVNADGTPGVTLADAAAGCCPPLRRMAGMTYLAAQRKLNLRVNWPGYKEWKSEIVLGVEDGPQTRVALETVAHCVAQAVGNFFKYGVAHPHQPDPLWKTGHDGGITRREIWIIGIIHVSVGNWMPILQLSRYLTAQLWRCM